MRASKKEHTQWHYWASETPLSEDSDSPYGTLVALSAVSRSIFDAVRTPLSKLTLSEGSLFPYKALIALSAVSLPAFEVVRIRA